MNCQRENVYLLCWQKAGSCFPSFLQLCVSQQHICCWMLWQLAGGMSQPSQILSLSTTHVITLIRGNRSYKVKCWWIQCQQLFCHINSVWDKDVSSVWCTETISHHHSNSSLTFMCRRWVLIGFMQIDVEAVSHLIFFFKWYTVYE